MDSSSAPEQSSGPSSTDGQGRAASIGRAFKRLKTALKISGSPKRDATSPTPTPANPPNQAEQQKEDPKPSLPVDAELEARSDMVLPGSEAGMLSLSSVNLDNLVVDDEAKPPSPPHDPTAYLMDSEHKERARLLFEKYGLSFEAKDLAPVAVPSSSSQRDSGVQRVEKQIRMRIRYNCHRCHTTFGATLICARCEHHRCRKCPRHPPKRPKRLHREGEAAQRESDRYGEAMEVDGETGTRERKSESPVATNVPTSETTFLQRASLICHKCQEAFSPIEAPTCAHCGHLRCPKCFRELSAQVDSKAALQDRPSGQPTQKIYCLPRKGIRWICDQCQTDFEPDSAVCSACLHDRCNSCTRIPDIFSLYGLVQSASLTPDSPVDLDPDPDITTFMQSHFRGFGVLHAPAIMASGSGG